MDNVCTYPPGCYQVQVVTFKQCLLCHCVFLSACFQILAFPRIPSWSHLRRHIFPFCWLIAWVSNSHLQLPKWHPQLNIFQTSQFILSLSHYLNPHPHNKTLPTPMYLQIQMQWIAPKSNPSDWQCSAGKMETILHLATILFWPPDTILPPECWFTLTPNSILL